MTMGSDFKTQRVLMGAMNNVVAEGYFPLAAIYNLTLLLVSWDILHIY